MNAWHGACLAFFGIAAAGSARADPSEERATPPDESLIEFLGGDDTGDAKWWDFLNRTEPKDKTSKDSEPPKDQK